MLLVHLSFHFMLPHIPDKDEPYGLAMHKSKKRGGLVMSPVQFNINDSIEVKLLKALVSSMTAYEPNNRPNIEIIITELENIAGKIKYQIRYHNPGIEQN